ncbi:hypothetical protein ACFX13_045924 [Malus domestica]
MTMLALFFRGQQIPMCQVSHIIDALELNAAYLIIRGMKTLHLRVQQQNSTALRMAKILEAHPKVAHAYYPGLPSHPEHQLAKRQMTSFGGVVSFEIDGDFMRTIKFVDALKIPYIAPSFGGCESIVDQPATMSYWDLSQSDRIKYGMKDNLVRFSFGVEDFEDLKADILQALETIWTVACFCFISHVHCCIGASIDFYHQYVSCVALTVALHYLFTFATQFV